MRALLLIAADSIRALLHRRLPAALMLAMLGLTVVFSFMLSEAQEWLLERVAQGAAEAESAGLDQEHSEQMRAVETMGSTFLAVFYWFAAFGGTITALAVCSTAVAADIRNGTVSMILAKPVSRTQFLLGKYCGAAAVLCGYSALTGIALMVFTNVNALESSPAAQYAPWLIFCQALMSGSAALLLSLLMHPLIAGVAAYFASASFLSAPNPLYFILPSYDRFNVFSHIVTGQLLSLEDIVMLTLYAFDVTAVCLLLALWRFRSQELS